MTIVGTALACVGWEAGPGQPFVSRDRHAKRIVTAYCRGAAYVREEAGSDPEGPGRRMREDVRGGSRASWMCMTLPVARRWTARHAVAGYAVGSARAIDAVHSEIYRIGAYTPETLI